LVDAFSSGKEAAAVRERGTKRVPYQVATANSKHTATASSAPKYLPSQKQTQGNKKMSVTKW